MFAEISERMNPVAKSEDLAEVIENADPSQSGKRNNCNCKEHKSLAEVMRTRHINAKDRESIECLEMEIVEELKIAELPEWFKLGMLNLIEDNQSIRNKIRQLLERKNRKSG
ncbi:unnamed protein product [Caenorhabditis angaria]|uniref:Uncharacterized protein n=1 Tax=Caenorhabditis angaria TaxID=860376 RepID=A0A9P1MSX4_9PELO|nr:unnamed protein product [Caenorhabditis angaria]